MSNAVRGMTHSSVGSALADFASGLIALGISALAVLVQPHSQTAFEYVLLGASAVLFPVATGLRASRSSVPGWATLVLVNVSVAVGAVILARAADTSVTPLLRLAAVIVGGSALAVLAATRWRSRWARGGMLLVTVVATLALVAWNMSSWLVRPVSHVHAPNVTLRMVDGAEVPVRSLHGSVVVLNFWGVYCAPCLRELPELEAVARMYRGNRGVFFAAVEIGQGKDAQFVRAFTAQHGIDLPVAFDADERVQRAFDVLGTPTTLVIDPEGIIRHRRVGYVAAANYTGWLTDIVDDLVGHPRS